MLKEALLADDRVTAVKIDKIDQIDSDTLAVSGICTTVYGDINIDSEVSVDNESR